MPKEKLNIVDDNDEIIGIEDRNTIHRKGLLHREAQVYFVTPNKEIIFQHRSKNKDTYPSLLDATVGGHVEIDNSYEQTAIKETFEETGIKIKENDLIIINKIHKSSKDVVTGMTNNAFQKKFIYIFKGKLENLKIEEGEALGFEIWSIEKLMNLDENEKLKFIPSIYKFTTTTLIQFIENKLNHV